MAAPEKWRRMGEETIDQLEKEPGYFYLRRLVRPKFVRRDQPFQAPIIAPAKPTIIDSGFWGSGLLSEILSNKYLYHLPLYRQEQLYHQRFGIQLSRKTMADAVEKVGDLLGLLVTRMKANMLQSSYIQADETPITYLDRTHPNGSRKGYYWVYRGLNGEVIFDWQTTREHKHLNNWLGKDFKGQLQSDGYEAYASYAKNKRLNGNPINHASCLAHIRRKFENARDQRPQTTRWFLKIIGRLYQIEKTLRDHQADAETRARIRTKRSRPWINLLQRAIEHLLTNAKGILPKSTLGQALRYACGQWSGMQIYLEHGEVEIDNNLVENTIRPTAIGKKNHLFIGHPEAGDRSATIYTLLISAKAQGVDPQTYLRDVIERLPTSDPRHLDHLTPANWAEAYHKQRTQEAA